jgi:hypothetical protein
LHKNAPSLTRKEDLIACYIHHLKRILFSEMWTSVLKRRVYGVQYKNKNLVIGLHRYTQTEAGLQMKHGCLK